MTHARFYDDLTEDFASCYIHASPGERQQQLVYHRVWRPLTQQRAQNGMVQVRGRLTLMLSGAGMEDSQLKSEPGFPGFCFSMPDQCAVVPRTLHNAVQYGIYSVRQGHLVLLQACKQCVGSQLSCIHMTRRHFQQARNASIALADDHRNAGRSTFASLS